MTAVQSPFVLVGSNRTTEQPMQFTQLHPGKVAQLKMNSQPFRSKSRMTYSISDLLTYRKNAIPFILPIDAQLALAEKNDIPYKTPMKKVHVEVEKEDDPHKIESRMKQLSYGKSSEGYEKYIEYVPLNKRVKGDPKTPDVYQKCSKRSWDGQVKKWRRALHAFDEITNEEDLKQIRLNLVTINATPNKQKVRVPMTEPVKRNEGSKFALSGRRLVFDDADVD